MNIIDLNLISEHYATLWSYLILKIHNTIGLLICTAYTFGIVRTLPVKLVRKKWPTKIMFFRSWSRRN